VYLALIHGLYVAARAAWLSIREGRLGRRKAAALLRGYRDALRTV
jgi:hypothetical protein